MRREVLAERVRGLRDGTLTAAEARDAATVVLLRDTAPDPDPDPDPAGSGRGGPETYLLRRVADMAFAAGMHVFPGGAVDPDDTAGALPGWAGPSPAQWGAALGCTEQLARGLVCAAVRETFEEAGVLLAGPREGGVLADVSTDDWEEERQRLEARERSLSQLLADRELVLRSDLLRPLAHWITPEAEPKRFDTRFFLAALPTGQVCREVGGEADQRLWIRPADALARELPMLPPTAAVLRAVADAPDVAAALAAERRITPVLAEFVLAGDGIALRMPPGTEG